VVIQHENDHLDGITIATADHSGSKDDFEPENLL
jgi:peptide deformylase